MDKIFSLNIGEESQSTLSDGYGGYGYGYGGYGNNYGDGYGGDGYGGDGYGGYGDGYGKGY